MTQVLAEAQARKLFVHTPKVTFQKAAGAQEQGPHGLGTEA